MREFSFVLQCNGRADIVRQHTLPNELSAWNHAARDCAEVIRDAALTQQKPTQCAMTVRNDQGRPIFEMRFEANLN